MKSNTEKLEKHPTVVFGLSCFALGWCSAFAIAISANHPVMGCLAGFAGLGNLVYIVAYMKQ